MVKQGHRFEVYTKTRGYNSGAAHILLSLLQYTGSHQPTIHIGTHLHIYIILCTLLSDTSTTHLLLAVQASNGLIRIHRDHHFANQCVDGVVHEPCLQIRNNLILTDLVEEKEVLCGEDEAM